MTFNQTTAAHGFVLRGILTEFLAQGKTVFTTAGDDGISKLFHTRLPQPTPSGTNKNWFGAKYHQLLESIALEFGYVKMYKQNAKRKSKVTYKLTNQPIFTN